MVTKSEMLKILQATEFPKNTGRTNVLKKGQTFSQSMVLGKVRKLYSSCNGKICLVDSRHNVKHKAVLKAAKALLKQHAPGYTLWQASPPTGGTKFSTRGRPNVGSYVSQDCTE